MPSSWAPHCNNVYTQTASCTYFAIQHKTRLSDPQVYICDHAAHDIRDTGTLYFRHNPFYSDLGYSLDNLGFNSQHEQEIFPFSKMFGLVPGSRLRMGEAILLLFLYAFMGCKETTVLFTAQNISRFAQKVAYVSSYICFQTSNHCTCFLHYSIYNILDHV